jgi:hypothetical protein
LVPLSAAIRKLRINVRPFPDDNRLPLDANDQCRLIRERKRTALPPAASPSVKKAETMRVRGIHPGWLAVPLTLAVALVAPAAAQATTTWTTLDFPGSTATFAVGIGPSGEIVGGYEDSGGALSGFILRHGTYTTLDVPGAADTAAAGINSSGEIVGNYRNAETTLGFLLTSAP